MTEGAATGDSQRRDVIVVGGSAGGLQPLRQVLADLPPDLAAAVFVVLHLGAASRLAEVLARGSVLPVRSAISGEAIVYGKVYAAVPDLHMLVHDSHLLLRRGPRENLARPAIDPLFRSAAASFGARVIGVVLSGALNDGVAGIRAIKRCGGVAVVQHPGDAAFPGMPVSALQHADVDYVIPANEMGRLLVRLSRELAGVTLPASLDIRLEAAIAAQERSGMTTDDALGVLARFTCPECGGALLEIGHGSPLRYCRQVRHAFAADVMLAAQANMAEELMWSLMRSHEERAALARRIAQRNRARNRDSRAQQFEAKAQSYGEDAAIIRGLLSNPATMEGKGG